MYFTPYFKNGMKLYMLGVGNYILMSPSGKVFMYDAGRKIEANNIVIPFLRKKGITEIESLMISHNHWDHIRGAQYIMDAFKVKKVFTKGVKSSGVFDSSISPAKNSRPPDVLAQDAMEYKMDKYVIDHQVVRRGDVIFSEGDFEITALDPTDEQVGSSDQIFSGQGQTVVLTENPYDRPPYNQTIETVWADGQLYSYRPGDAGLVIKIRFGETTIVLPADRLPGNLDDVSDVTVYAPTHHGDSRYYSNFRNGKINAKLVLLEYNHNIDPDRGGLGRQGSIDFFEGKGIETYDFLGEVDQKDGYEKKRLELTLNDRGKYSITHVNERDI